MPMADGLSPKPQGNFNLKGKFFERFAAHGGMRHGRCNLSLRFAVTEVRRGVFGGTIVFHDGGLSKRLLAAAADVLHCR
jgi:hypothetical protein